LAILKIFEYIALLKLKLILISFSITGKIIKKILRLEIDFA